MEKEVEELISITLLDNERIEVSVNYEKDPTLIANCLRRSVDNLSEVLAYTLLNDFVNKKMDKHFIETFSKEWKTRNTNPLVRASQVTL